MVKGLGIFRDHFRDLSDQFVLIGGAACDIAMENVGLTFRATKDLDIVLCVEALDSNFVNAFWDFVSAGKYQIQEKADGSKQYYRFQRPAVSEYPFMLELFSRKPDALSIVDESHLTPIPTDEQISSLSAILLEDAYYEFLHSGKRVLDGVPFVGPEHLIPLKARAWLDLTKRREGGESIDSRTIKKHKNDVFRLFRIIDPNFSTEMPDVVLEDFGLFLAGMEKEDIDMKSLGITTIDRDDVIKELKRIYGLG